MYRYLCIHRPPMPGGIPKGAKNVEYLDYYTEDPAGHRVYVFGAVEYDHPLTDEEISDYELLEDGE